MFIKTLHSFCAATIMDLTVSQIFIFRNKSHKAEPLFALICMARSQPVLPWQDCTKLW